MAQLVVQHVGVWWTKATRAAPAATRRNALPLAFLLPQSPSPYLFHEVLFRERDDDFAETSRHHRAEDVPRTRELSLTFQRRDGELVIGYNPQAHAERPWRGQQPNVLVVPDGRYGRVIVNARHVHEVTLYTQDTYNVALLDRPATTELFVARAPDVVRDLRADLF